MTIKTGKEIIIHLFKGSDDSFTKSLDEAGIEHWRPAALSSQIQASGTMALVKSISDLMPWNQLAKVLVSWIEVKKSRKVIFNLGEGKSIHLEGYSVKEVERILEKSESIMVIETRPDDKI